MEEQEERKETMEDKSTTKKKNDGANQKVSFFKLFSFADKIDVGLMTVGTLAAICNGLTQPLMTLIFGELINAFGTSDPDHMVREVWKVAIKFIYLAVYACVVAFLQVTCWMVTGERQSATIRGLYLKTILRQDIGYFDTETNTGEVIGRMSGDTILIQDAMGEKVGKCTQLITTFIGGFAIAFYKGPLLALVLSSCIPLIVIAGGAMSLIMSKMAGRGQIAYADAGNVVEQTVGAIRTVVAFTGEKQATEKYESKLEVAYKTMVRQGLISGLGLGTMLAVIFSSYGLAVWYGAKLIIEKGYNGGQVINVIFAVLTGGMSLGQTSPSLNAFAAGQAAAYKMFETIKRSPKIDAYDMRGSVLEDIRGDIELKDIYFRYPARPDVQIFAGFSLFVPKGTTVALVGQSGSGKSTVISLIERFYDPESGQVLIDNIDLKNLQLKWIRSKIGLVSQEPVLFATTIKENIAYGKEDASDEEIRTAVELANAAKFIDKLPQGLDTMVGEHGTQMSGGQKQRLAIARAILKNPKILLLDEATSALDAESERIVQDALVNLMSNRTTVVVAHRLTTIRTADAIAVVHQGKIVEKGTHDEMIQDPEGAYSQLVRLQEGSKEEANESERLEPSLDERSGSRRLSSAMRRSVSRNSSSSRHSFSLASNIFLPGAINVNQTEDFEGEETTVRHKKVSLKRLARLNKPEIPVLFLGSIAALAHGTLFPIFGLLLSSSINMFYEPASILKKDARFWALIYVALAVANFVVIPIQNYFFGIAGGKLIKRIRSMSFDKVVHQEISWFDDPSNSSGAIGARLSTDASAVRSLVGDAMALIVQNMATLATGLIIAFTANWMLALIVLALSPFIVAQGYIQMKFLAGFSGDAKVMYEEASQVANDAVSSIRTVASFCAEGKVMDLYQQKCDGPKKNGVRLGLYSGAGFGSSFFFLYCINAVCFVSGAALIQIGKATFGEVFKVFFALTIMAIGVSQTSALAPDTNKAKDSAASIFDILDSKPKIDSSSDEGTTLQNVHGDIEFKHVSFRYPMRPDVQIFRDLCLTIPSGKTVALVGESGSGKSTVISMIERFYNPDSGKILIDQVEIQTFKLSWLRQQMGLVSQEPILFNENIRSNIAYGKTGGATEEEIISAAKAANAHNFISSLPQGYETSVGERGVQLSGGQKQRIAIARAILKDPKILLLDEATSALDAESERVVQDALDRVMVNRTTVVVAHRLTTIKNADVIAVVKNGVIAEKGRHETLMKISDGEHTDIWQDKWIQSLPPAAPKPLNQTSATIVSKPSQLMLPLARQWDIRKVQELIHPDDVHKILLTRPSAYSPKDKYLWPISSNGKYTVKTGYQLLFQSNISRHIPSPSLPPITHRLCRKLWTFSLPPKIKNFWWKVIHNGLPTLTNLQSRHVPVDTTCKLCGDLRESVDHIMTHCRVTKETWTLIIPQAYTTNHLSVIDFIEHLWKNCKGGDTPLSTFIGWGIWKARNCLMFNNIRKAIPEIINEANDEQSLWLTHGRPPDNSAQNQASRAQRLTETSRIRQNKTHCLVDASWTTNNSQIGIAWTYLDPTSNKLAEGKGAFPPTLNPKDAEAQAILEASTKIKLLGAPGTTIFSDAKQVIDAVNHFLHSPTHTPTTSINTDLQAFSKCPFIEDICNIATSISPPFKYIFIPRTETKEVDAMAKQARQLSLPYTIRWF